MKLLIVILMIVISSFCVSAYTPEWYVSFDNTLGGNSIPFIAGSGYPATDGYDQDIDLIQPILSLDISVQMRAIVGNEALMADYRGELNEGEPKTWEIILFLVDTSFEGLSGTNKITWSIYNISDTEVKLIDYGDDETRSNIVETIDLNSDDSYEFEVNKAIGPYRYLDFVAGDEPIIVVENVPGGGSFRIPDEDEINYDMKEIILPNEEIEVDESEFVAVPISTPVDDELIVVPTSAPVSERVVYNNEPNVFIGVSIVILIVGVGLIIFFMIFRKSK